MKGTIDISKFSAFDWDDGNVHKNKDKHNVIKKECEEVFFNKPYIVLYNQKHSIYENRFFIYGYTDKKRFLTIIFTVRENKIRVISARDQSKKEKTYYINKTNDLYPKGGEL
ncbi:MAG: BrnT family toxin [Patescibacteria group bacterium]